MALKQSICWWCFAKDIEPEKLVKAAAEIGYAAIELVDQQHWPLIKDHGLAISAIGGHGTIIDGLNRRGALGRITGEIEANLELAVKWGIPNLICFSGSHGGLDDVVGAEITAENLRKLAPLAEKAGVTLVLELLNSKVDHPDYQCDTTPWGVKVVEKVASPRVKLLYDIYHMQIMEGDLIRTIEQNHQHFGHYHTAGNPGRSDIDASQEINYPPIISAINATGYEGYLGQEFMPKGDPISALKTAYDICNG